LLVGANPVPVTVRVNAEPPAAAVDGDRLERTGTGLREGVGVTVGVAVGVGVTVAVGVVGGVFVGVAVAVGVGVGVVEPDVSWTFRSVRVWFALTSLISASP